MTPDPLGLSAVLEDGALRLEPLEERHRADLRAACAEDAAIWQMYGVSYDPEHFDESFCRAADQCGATAIGNCGRRRTGGDDRVDYAGRQEPLG